MRVAWELLAPGGVWINVGPLHWHQPALGFLRLRCVVSKAKHQDLRIWHAHGTRVAHAWRTQVAHACSASSCGSWEELRGLLRLRGFTLREHRVIRRVPYLGRPARRSRDELLSGVDSWHDAILFVAQKRG